MRIFQSVLLLAFFLIFITVVAVWAPAHAADRPGFFGSGTFLGDGSETNYSIPPYLNDAHTPNGMQWRIQQWDVSRWIYGPQQGLDLIDHFYKTGLITDQTTDDDMPVLEVGDLFLRLSDQDKRKVLMLVDQVYGVTSASAFGAFYVEHDRTNTILGAYTKFGMQLQ